VKQDLAVIKIYFYVKAS